MPKCAPGCTCQRHVAIHPPCSGDCTCKRHDHPGPVNSKCLAGCNCPRHQPRPRGSDHPSWKGDNITDSAGNRRAQRLFTDIGPCSKCGKEPAERHHKDKDPTNNDPSNVEILCRKCHIAADGTLVKCKPGCQCYRHISRPCPPDCICGRHDSSTWMRRQLTPSKQTT